MGVLGLPLEDLPGGGVDGRVFGVLLTALIGLLGWSLRSLYERRGQNSQHWIDGRREAAEEAREQMQEQQRRHDAELAALELRHEAAMRGLAARLERQLRAQRRDIDRLQQAVANLADLVDDSKAEQVIEMLSQLAIPTSLLEDLDPDPGGNPT